MQTEATMKLTRLLTIALLITINLRADQPTQATHNANPSNPEQPATAVKPDNSSEWKRAGYTVLGIVVMSGFFYVIYRCTSGCPRIAPIRKQPSSEA